MLEVMIAFFEVDKEYKIAFNHHSAKGKLLEARKAKVVEISKIVPKEDGKTPKCYLLQFETFRLIINIEDIKAIESIANGIRIQMEYAIDFTKL